MREQTPFPSFVSFCFFSFFFKRKAGKDVCSRKLKLAYHSKRHLDIQSYAFFAFTADVKPPFDVWRFSSEV